jgi:hypothetical protein
MQLLTHKIYPFSDKIWHKIQLIFNKWNECNNWGIDECNNWGIAWGIERKRDDEIAMSRSIP